MTEWNAIVNWIHPAEPTEDALDDFIGQLLPYSPAIGLRPATDAGRVPMSATLTIEAVNLRQAIHTALSAVEIVTGQTAVGVEVITRTEFVNREGLSNV